MAKPLPAKVTVTRAPLNGDPEESIVFDYDAQTPAWLEPFSIRRSISNGVSEVTLNLDNEARRFDSWRPGDLIRLTIQGPRDLAAVVAFSGFVTQLVEVVGVAPRLEVRCLSLKELLDAITVRSIAPTTGDPLCTEAGETLWTEDSQDLTVEASATINDGDNLMTEDYENLLAEDGSPLLVDAA